MACDGSEPSARESAPVTAAPAPAQAPKAPVGGAVELTREQRVAALKKVLEPRLNRSQEGLKVETLAANRKKSVRLEGRFGHATVLRVNPDGTRERGCFDQAEPAIEFMTRERSR